MISLALTAALGLAVAGRGLADSAPFSLASATFKEADMLPQATSYNADGCTGANTSPELHWTAPPKATKSFALTMFDPDAPRRGGWWHWMMFNIPETTRQLRSGAGAGDGKLAPVGATQGTTDFGSPGYGGPCPPPGNPHRYVFTLYALDEATVEGAGPSTTGPELLKLIDKHVLAKATLTGRFGR